MSKKRAVLGILSTREDTCILLLKRSETDSFYPNFFSLPGGHVEEEESDIQALVREFIEETGKRVRITNFYTSFETPEKTVNVYLVEDLTPNQEIKLNPKEHSAYHEFTIDSIYVHKDIITPKVYDILEEIRILSKMSIPNNIM